MPHRTEHSATAMILRCYMLCRVSSSSGSSTAASSRVPECPREMMLKDFAQVAFPIQMAHGRLLQAMLTCQRRKCKHL